MGNIWIPSPVMVVFAIPVIAVCEVTALYEAFRIEVQSFSIWLLDNSRCLV